MNTVRVPRMMLPGRIRDPEATHWGGDYFGRTVNIAARIGEYARPGEVLVSQDVVDADGLDHVDFTAIGPVELKGISEPLLLHSARGS